MNAGDGARVMTVDLIEGNGQETRATAVASALAQELGTSLEPPVRRPGDKVLRLGVDAAGGRLSAEWGQAPGEGSDVAVDLVGGGKPADLAGTLAIMSGYASREPWASMDAVARVAAFDVDDGQGEWLDRLRLPRPRSGPSWEVGTVRRLGDMMGADAGDGPLRATVVADDGLVLSAAWWFEDGWSLYAGEVERDGQGRPAGIADGTDLGVLWGYPTLAGVLRGEGGLGPDDMVALASDDAMSLEYGPLERPDPEYVGRILAAATKVLRPSEGLGGQGLHPQDPRQGQHAGRGR